MPLRSLQAVFPVLWRETETLDPVRARLVPCEGPVGRENDAVDTHLGNAARKRSVREISACRQMEMPAEGFTERHAAADRARQEFVDAPKKKRQPLPEMAEYDHQPGILFKHAAQDHSDRLRRRLHREAPHRTDQFGIPARIRARTGPSSTLERAACRAHVRNR